MIGESIAHYTITGKLGAGGMGEVYRATDGKLGREVALKILPDAFSSDAERMARFQREAQVLASLNHPNIAAIYGVEEHAGRRCLVLELVEGEDLSDRLRAGPISLSEACEIARQIAEALEAAHDKGIIHRDLKPANVKLTPSGAVKVLDYGLAKALDEELGPGAGSMTHSPTMTSAATRAGVIMGTAAYMSPEQAKGKPVDRRADIWSFGVVLFEMVTRRPLFESETVSETLASVLKTDPNWEDLPAGTPPGLRDLLRRCLEKDPRQRLQSIGEARIAIQLLQREPSAATGAGAIPAVPRRGPGWLAWGAGMIFVAVVAAAAARLTAPEPPDPKMRLFTIAPEDLSVDYTHSPVISPDGRHIAFVANGSIWIRDLESLEPIEVLSSEGAQALFWSPDGSSLAFGVNQRLFRVAATGGRPAAICNLPFNLLDAGAWGPDDTLYLAPNNGGIHAVSAQGGDPHIVIPAENGKETDFHTPSVLPDGSLLYTTHRTEGRDTIEVFSEGVRKVLLRIEGTRLEFAAYVPSGYIIYHRQTTNQGIWAVPFSLRTKELTGEPFILDPDGGFSSVTRDGTLLYVLGAGSGTNELVWLDRKGQVIGTLGQPEPGLELPEISPDGERILVSSLEGDNRDIWMLEASRGTRTRLTFSNEFDWGATWVPGGRRIAYYTGSGSGNRIMTRAADGTDEPQLLAEGFHASFTDDAQRMIFVRFGGESAGDLYTASIDGKEPVVFLRTPSVEVYPQISPDGRYVSYHSDESGTLQVYVKSFPSGDGKWQVSVDGGRWARWARQGKEILFMGTQADLMSVSVDGTEPLRLGAPKRLFGAVEAPDLIFGGGNQTYDVTADGERLLFVRVAGDRADRVTARMVLSENWLEAYRKRGR